MLNNKAHIYSFYRFKSLKNPKNIKKRIENIKVNKVVLGTILVAEEGINGTISGIKEDLHLYMLIMTTLKNY